MENEDPEIQGDKEEEIEWTEEDFVTVELVVSTGNTDEIKKVRNTKQVSHVLPTVKGTAN